MERSIPRSRGQPLWSKPRARSASTRLQIGALATHISEGHAQNAWRREIRATDGQAALAAFECNVPDWVLLDLMLPKLNSLQVLKRLRAHPVLPIIMLTAKRDELDRVLGLDLGADDHIVKPFSPRNVVAREKRLA